MNDLRRWMNAVLPLTTLTESWVSDPLSDPAFRQWFGNSVIRDKDGKPLRVYHGTHGQFDAFSNRDSSTGMIFFAIEPQFASGYANTIVGGGGGRVIPCYLRIEKLYDFRTKRDQDIASNFFSHYHYGHGLPPWCCHQIRVALYGSADVEDDDNPDVSEDQISHEEWMTAIRQGEYPALECDTFIDWIKRSKYDGMVMIEGGSVNYAVFSPRQIKSAVSNTGKFNRRSAKLGESDV